MNLINDISSIVKEAFLSCGYDEKLGGVVVSNRPDLCQFTCNGAMAGAKIYKKAPIAIATEISEVLKKNPIFEKIEAINPGFINITLTNKYLEDILNKINSLEDLITKVDNEKIIIDYGGPNVAKPLHVGHMRTANIGEAIKRTAKFLGYNVIGDAHLGDWGLPLGLVILEIKERYPDLDYFKENYVPSESDKSPVTIDELNEIYPFASAKSKADPEYRKKAMEITKALQEHETSYYELWKQIISMSIEDMKVSYDMLNVSFELWNGESTCSDYVPKLIERLNEKGLTYESEGAIVVDVSREDDKIEIPPIIIKKSDGAQLYSTSDLATIMERKKEFDPKQILYVVDSRQSLHFVQVFRCAKKAELVDDNVNLEFIGFGTMNGKDGKPYKTREGGVMRLSDLLDQMINAAFEKVKENYKEDAEISKEEMLDISNKVGVAALKFGDLYNQRTKDYVFDMDRFLSFEGKTGPYLLYTIARINSILRKAGDFKKVDLKLYTETETELSLAFILTEDILYRAFNDKSPNYICEHIYNLAVLLNKFYNDRKILTEPDENKKASWLNLLSLIKDGMEKLLDILAISTVERM